jgi:hypothetical protein
LRGQFFVHRSLKRVTFRQARAFIAARHRHHPPPVAMKFALGAAAEGALVGVATVGRPIARLLDDGSTAEVTHTCTRQLRNTNSMLYAAAWRAARAMGYERVITYTQHGESGASLRAAGYTPVASGPASSAGTGPADRGPPVWSARPERDGSSGPLEQSHRPELSMGRRRPTDNGSGRCAPDPSRGDHLQRGQKGLSCPRPSGPKPLVWTPDRVAYWQRTGRSPDR